MITLKQKQELKNQLVASLKGDKDIRKVVVFGSFLTSDNPNDMDVAVFQDSPEGYIQLAMKYRKLTRAVSKKMPIDIIPIKPGAVDASILPEIENGEVVYER
jgi:predicted nucleotidyltransferase